MASGYIGLDTGIGLKPMRRAGDPISSPDYYAAGPSMLETLKQEEPKLTGGKVNYYLAQIKHPRREEQSPYQAECEDIIEALGMTFDEGCAFKALWRTAAARLGNGKPGHKAVYDMEKVVHYGKNCLRTAKLKEAEYADNQRAGDIVP